MSNLHNYREPRRRGLDYGPQEPERDYLHHASPRIPAAAGSRPVVVEVLWFNSENGFGVVKLSDRLNAFLHVSTLEHAGHSTVSEGMGLTVRIEQGQKGLLVAEVLAVNGEIASDVDKFSFRRGYAVELEVPLEKSTGTVKRYNAKKGNWLHRLANRLHGRP